jgi:hypothetical protein
MNDCNFILRLFLLYTGLSCEQTVSFVRIYVWCMCLFIRVSAVYYENMWLSVTHVCQCTVTEFLVKEKQLKCSDFCVCISATGIRRWVMWNRDVCEEHTWMCQYMMHVANTMTYFVANDESFNQEMKWQLGVACHTVSKQESWNCTVGQQGNGSM